MKHKPELITIALVLFVGAIALNVPRYRTYQTERAVADSLQRTYAVPDPLLEPILAAAKTWNIPADLAIRLVRAESEFRVQARSPSGAAGLTQLTLRTARHFDPTVTRKDLLDPEVNLNLGFQYLASLYAEFKDWRLAVLSYRDGPAKAKAVRKLGGSYVDFIAGSL